MVLPWLKIWSFFCCKIVDWGAKSACPPPSLSNVAVIISVIHIANGGREWGPFSGTTDVGNSRSSSPIERGIVCPPTDRAGATATFKKAKGAFILLCLAIIWGFGKKNAHLRCSTLCGRFYHKVWFCSLFLVQEKDWTRITSHRTPFSVCAHSLLQQSSTHKSD